MSDNVIITPGVGNTVAADEVVDGTLGTVKVQYVKIMDGTLDGISKAAVSSNGLKVDGSGVTQPVSLTSTTVTNTVTVMPDYSTGITPVMKTGTLVTTAVTADQVILTYTVTAGKTLYLQYFSSDVRLTAVSATASILGTYSLEAPAGTKLITHTNVNPTTSETYPATVTFSQPLPFSAGTVIRVVTTPAATTSMTWVANFGGFEK